MTNTKALEKLQQMRAFVIKKAPYWSRAIMGFVYVPVPGLGTVAVTKGMVFLYDPEYVANQKLSVLGFDGAHEIMHPKLKHFERAERLERANQELWNYAGDEVINQMLLEAGWDVAEDALLPERQNLPIHLSTEEYYLLLKEKQNKGSPKPEPKPGDHGAKSPGDAASSPGDKGEGEGEGDGKGEGKHEADAPRAKCGQGRCGGGAGNPVDPELEAKMDAEHGRSEIDCARIYKQVARDIQKYVAGRGTVPGMLAEWAKVALEPSVIHWEDELAALLHDCTGNIRAGAEDYSLRRPSKHSYMRGLMRPGLVEYTPEFAFLLDTSGSMSTKQMLAGMREAAAILLALNIEEVWFAQVDTAVAMAFERVPLSFFLGDVQFKGRGGTDFRPGFAAMEKLGPPPDVAVYFTDGDGPAPAAKPDNLEVLWCIVPGAYTRVPATWGKTLLMQDKVQTR